MSTQAIVLIDSAATQTMGDSVVFPGLAGAVTGTGSAIAAQVTALAMKTYFSGGVASEFTTTTAIATPAAYVATTFTGFASTVSGASLMGFGTTNDVTLMNRAGTNQVGTLTNAPVAGNPAFWMPISIAGTIRYVPCW